MEPNASSHVHYIPDVEILRPGFGNSANRTSGQSGMPNEKDIVLICSLTLSSLFCYISILTLFYLTRVRKKCKPIETGGGIYFISFFKVLLSLTLALDTCISASGYLNTSAEIAYFFETLFAIIVLHFSQIWRFSFLRLYTFVASVLFVLTRCSQLYLWLGNLNISHVFFCVAVMDMFANCLTAICDLIHLLSKETKLLKTRKSFLETNKPSVEGNSLESQNSFQLYTHNGESELSKLSYAWFAGILTRGFFVPLEVEDLGTLVEEEGSKHLLKENEELFEKFLVKKSLWHAYRVFLGKAALWSGVFKFLGDVTALLPSLCISVIITYATGGSRREEISDLPYSTWETFLSNGYVIGVYMFVSILLQGTLSQLSSHIICVQGINLQAVLQGLIYKKTLVSHSHCDLEEKDSQGNPDNILVGDTNNIMSFVWNIHYIWAIPFKVFLIICFLYVKMGWSAIAGTACSVLVLLPAQLFLFKKMASNSESLMEATDSRLKRLVEFLANVKVVKLQAAEDQVEEEISSYRNIELKLLNKDSTYWAVLSFMTQATSVLVSVTTFAIHGAVSETPLTLDVIFASLALFNQLTVPLALFPATIPIFLNAKKSTARILKYLTRPDVTERNVATLLPLKQSSLVAEATSIYPRQRSDFTDKTLTTLENILEEEASPDVTTSCQKFLFETGMIVRFLNVSFGSNPSLLSEVTFGITKAQLTLVTGPICSGKSLLLASLLGDVEPSGGKIIWSEANTKIAYVNQKPWIMSATVRDNVLFGHTYRQKRYEKVLIACCLDKDIESFPDRDETWVAENGDNISGGQRQRIALARAVYSNSDLILLDDPLSALDPEVSQKVFAAAIMGLLVNRRKTVVVASNDTSLARSASQVIFLKDGSLSSCGPQQVPSDIRIDRGCPSRKQSTVSWQNTKDASSSNLQMALRRRQSTRQALQQQHFALHESYILDEYHILRTEEEEDRIVFERPSKTPAFRTYSAGAVPSSSRLPSFYKRQSVISNRSEVFRPDAPKSSNPFYNMIWSKKKRDLLDLRRKSTMGNFPRGRSGTVISIGSYRSNRGSVHFRDKNVLRRLVSTASGFSDDGSVFDSEAGILTRASADEEQRLYGALRRNTYFSYLTSGGIFLGIFSLLLTVASQVFRVYIDYSLSWAQDTSLNNSLGVTPNGSHGPDEFKAEHGLDHLHSYFFFSSAFVVLSMAMTISSQLFGSFARKKLHSKLLATVVNCPLQFFEATPSGRILNRFSADMSIIDKKISLGIQRWAQFSLLCLSSIVVNAFVSSWTLILSAVMMVVYYLVQHVYRMTARELQRIESITRSPVISHFLETVSGASTVRAFEVGEKFQNEFHKKLDVNVNASLILNAGNRWLGFNLDLLGAFIVFASTMSCLLVNQFWPDSLSASQIGVAINCTLVVPIYLTWIVRFTSESEANMGSVERLQAYLDLPRPDGIKGTTSVKESWPEHGAVCFRDVTVSLGDPSEPILRNINLSVKAGEKVGICGRTGSGKSTLLLSLFNLVEEMEGFIFIDNVDTQRIPEKTLRKNMCIAAQDTCIFATTLRRQLDPLEVHSDIELLSVLQYVQLAEDGQTPAQVLDSKISRESYSLGELQLLSIARVLLSPSKIIVLDEVTSALDDVMEKAVLELIEDTLKDRTIIMVAHRPASLLFCDRILVLEKGRIVEEGDPNVLKNIPNSHFASLMRFTFPPA